MTDEPKKERKKPERAPADTVIQTAGRCWRLMKDLSPNEKVLVAKFLFERARETLSQEHPQEQLRTAGVPQRSPSGTLFD